MGPEAADADSDGGRPLWWRHPVAWYEADGRRFLPGVLFPLAVFVVWRVVHLLLVHHFISAQGVPNAWAGVGSVSENYDGERYLMILGQGYAAPGADMPNTAFFPMISWASAPVYWINRSTPWTVHIMATITAIGAFIGVWGVAKVWRGEFIARRAVLLLALSPASLFLWAFYSEGLFILLGTGIVWADRRGHRGLAAALCVPMAATRSVGVLVPLVMVLVHVIEHGPPLREELRRWWGPVVAGVAALSVVVFSITVQVRYLAPGLAAVALWAVLRRRVDRWSWLYLGASAVGVAAVCIVMWKQAGDPLAWLKVQEDWGRGLDQPWKAVIQGFENLWPDADTIMVPALVARNLDIWSVFLVAFPVAYAGLSRRDRFPMETWMLGVMLIALPLYSSVLASFNRFALADWVIYPVYGSFLTRIPKPWRTIPWAALCAGSAVATWQMVERFSADRFVG